MKRYLVLIVVVFAANSSANSQRCNDCSTIERAERVERPTVTSTPHNAPERPKLSTFVDTGKPYYVQKELKFAVTNDVAKKVKQITWECTLVHPDSDVEIAKYVLVTRKKIAPHKGATLKEKVQVPLGSFYGSKVIPVDQVGKQKYELPDVVQAIQFNKVLEIRYADGSVDHPE